MKFLKYSIISVTVVILSLFIWGKLYSASQPGIVILQRFADTTRIKNDLSFLTEECRYRNYQNMNSLNKAADYIRQQFLQISTRVEEQKYSSGDREYKNIICSLGPEEGERLIIGAHYDVCGDQDGADDNASGTAGLLELARLLKNAPLKFRIDFVAYSLEEPPFFKTKLMGSYVHAKSLYDNKVKILGMICLEMIGYYSGMPKSQSYPVFFLKWFYGNTADFITVVRKYDNDVFGRFITRTMKKDQVIPTKSFQGPAWLPGVDFSDHLNYWKYDYSAVMITNTAFYRNRNYHTTGDSLATIDLGKTGLVIDEVYRTVLKLNDHKF